MNLGVFLICTCLGSKRFKTEAAWEESQIQEGATAIAGRTNARLREARATKAARQARRSAFGLQSRSTKTTALALVAILSPAPVFPSSLRTTATLLWSVPIRWRKSSLREQIRRLQMPRQRAYRKSRSPKRVGHLRQRAKRSSSMLLPESCLAHDVLHFTMVVCTEPHRRWAGLGSRSQRLYKFVSSSNCLGVRLCSGISLHIQN